MISVRLDEWPPGLLSVEVCRKLLLCSFLAQYLLNVTLCMVILPIELCLFIPLSVTWTVFHGHSSVKQY